MSLGGTRVKAKRPAYICRGSRSLTTKQAFRDPNLATNWGLHIAAAGCLFALKCGRKALLLSAPKDSRGVLRLRDKLNHGIRIVAWKRI